MLHSEQINELAAALSKAQGEMQAAIKDKVNPFYKSSYADLGSVWDAARPVLCKYGLSVTQITDLLPDNKVKMVTMLMHTSGQWIKSDLPLNPSKNDSQGLGAAITYLRRYSLSAIVGVVCDDDDDGEEDAGRGKSKANESPKKNTLPEVECVGKEEVANIANLLNQLDEGNRKNFFDWVKKNFNVQTIAEIPKAAFEKCTVSLTTKINFLKDQQKAVA